VGLRAGQDREARGKNVASAGDRTIEPQSSSLYSDSILTELSQLPYVIQLRQITLQLCSVPSSSARTPKICILLPTSTSLLVCRLHGQPGERLVHINVSDDCTAFIFCVKFYTTIRRHNPEYHNQHIHLRENLKSLKENKEIH
jgi:hypothetical protein